MYKHIEDSLATAGPSLLTVKGRESSNVRLIQTFSKLLRLLDPYNRSLSLDHFHAEIYFVFCRVVTIHTSNLSARSPHLSVARKAEANFPTLRKLSQMKYIPWLLLTLTTLYRLTWGRPDPSGLRRRLALAHRETAEWRAEAIQWKQLAVLLDGPSFKETE